MTTTPQTPSFPQPSQEQPLTMTARSPDDLLAVVPIVLGFVPSDSVVLLTFGAERPFHARIDLPNDPVAHRAVWDELADVLLDPASHHRAERVAICIYTDDAASAGAAWSALRQGCRRRGIPVVDALRVADGRYYPFLAGDPARRERGVAFDIDHHRFAVQAVVSGRVTHGSRAELAATLAPDPDAVARIRPLVEALERWEALDPPTKPVLLREGRWVRDLVEDHALAGTEPTDAETARLLRGLVLLRVRDAAWSTISRESARAHRDLWTRLLRRTPPPWVPPVATLLGWSAWQAGEGALAWCAVDRCAEVDPDYSLMQLLGQALDRAIPPSDWQADVDWAVGL